MIKTYETACEAHSEATRVFHVVTQRYRDMEIGDDEFLAARTIYNESTAAYDAAYDAEAERLENIVEEVEDTDDGQMALNI